MAGRGGVCMIEHRGGPANGGAESGDSTISPSHFGRGPGWEGQERARTGETLQPLKTKLTQTARLLRRNATKAEALLWRHLRSRRMEGIRFRRQQPLGHSVVDFVSFDARIVVEVDGGQHATDVRDHERDRWLRQQGYRVLRFWNNDVLSNLTGVLEVIRVSCVGHPPLAPPVKGGESGGA